MAIVNSNITSINEVDYATKTYKLNKAAGRIMGYIDGIDAVHQSAEKIIQTERYAYEIYSNDYGVEIESLIGQDEDYVISVLEPNLAEGLTMDSRINSVTNFNLDATDLDNITPSFTINTTYGNTTL